MQIFLKETKSQQSLQVDSVEEDSPRVVDNRQLFEQKEMIPSSLGKDIDKLKLFEGAGGQQSEQARRQASIRTGQLKEHQEVEGHVKVSMGDMMNKNVTSTADSSKKMSNTGQEARPSVCDLREVFEPARLQEKQGDGVVEVTGGQGVEANNDLGREGRKVVKAKRRKGSVGCGLVQARIQDFLKLSGKEEATQGISKKRKVASLEEKLKPSSNKKKKK
jgi:hypothetical protein